MATTTRKRTTGKPTKTRRASEYSGLDDKDTFQPNGYCYTCDGAGTTISSSTALIGKDFVMNYDICRDCGGTGLRNFRQYQARIKRLKTLYEKYKKRKLLCR